MLKVLFNNNCYIFYIKTLEYANFEHIVSQSIGSSYFNFIIFTNFSSSSDNLSTVIKNDGLIALLISSKILFNLGSYKISLYLS